MNKIICFIALWCITFVTLAQEEELQVLKTKADTAYVQERYHDALALYQRLASVGSDANVYYNLGCTYYRLDSLSKSILWLERAHKLNPHDEDILANLEFVRTQVIDHITPLHDNFMTMVYRYMVYLFTIPTWAVISFVFFVLALLSLCMYLYLHRISLRRIGFIGTVLFFIFSSLGNVFLLQQKWNLTHQPRAVLVSHVTTVRSTPSQSGNELFILHEGTCFEIVDEGIQDWAQITIADGKTGWVQKSNYIKI